MPHILGLTGNIACGKTTVGRFLLASGVELYIDADAVVHQLYRPGQEIALAIEKEFGSEYLSAEGVDRQRLGELVFQDKQAMKSLEKIVHPAVGKALLKELEQVSERGIAVIDAVKLLEGGSGRLCEKKWLVVCPEEQEFQRLVERNHLTSEEAWTRIRAQPSNEHRRKLVDEVINNGGSLEETRAQVAVAFQRFRDQVLD